MSKSEEPMERRIGTFLFSSSLLACRIENRAGGKLLAMQDHHILRKLDQLPHAPIRHAVVHEFATPLTCHKATPAQTLQMGRDAALPRANQRDQFADVALALQQRKQ